MKSKLIGIDILREQEDKSPNPQTPKTLLDPRRSDRSSNITSLFSFILFLNLKKKR
eukprot:COSAG05_NODE_16088_length_354_cov_0.200000_1_plen_55_part_10